MLFDVRADHDRGWAVVRVRGEVDLASLPLLAQHLDRRRDPAVALDLDGVDLWDPVAFGVVVAAALRARRRAGRFAVVCAPGRIRELFRESRVDRIVEVRDRCEDLEDLSVGGDAGQSA